MKAVGYIRVSTDEQSLSLQAQKSEIEAWCRRHDATLLEVHADEGISGAAPLEKSPGLLRAVGAASEHKAYLVVQRRDRLARDTYRAVLVDRTLRESGGSVQCADGGVVDPDDPEVRLMLGIADLMSQYERAVISRRIKRVMQLKKERGERVGGIPYGFRLDSDGVHLRPDPYEQQVISVAQGLRGEGLSCTAVAARLEQMKVIPRGGRWNHKLIKRITEEI